LCQASPPSVPQGRPLALLFHLHYSFAQRDLLALLGFIVLSSLYCRTCMFYYFCA